MDPDDRIYILDEAIDHLARAGELLRLLGDPLLDAYLTPQPEGHEGGWLGEHAVDHVRAARYRAPQQHGEEAFA